MSDSKIEWCRDGDGRKGKTWNPIAGCSVHTPGCTNCYAMKMAARLEAISIAHETKHGGDPGPLAHYRGLTQHSKAGPVWTGRIGIAPDRTLTKPLRWKKPRRIFVNSMSDLFHPSVPDEVIDRVFAVMALCPQHTFQLLTKRSARMREYVSSLDRAIVKAFTPPHQHPLLDDPHATFFAVIAPNPIAAWPFPNVHLGVSVEDQARADQRIPDLLATPAAVHWISAEPLLGPVDLGKVFASRNEHGTYLHDAPILDLDWVVCGGESGKNARPMHPDWARSLRDQCSEAGVPFFFKQWGEWVPQSGAIDGWSIPEDSEVSRYAHRDWEGDHWGADYNPAWCDDVEDDTVARVGKRVAGRQLDGVLHDEFPA